jgi:glutamine synthetase
MQPGDIRSKADAKAIVEQRGLDYVRVGLSDVDGIMRGKYMSRDKFFSALDGGFGFCDVVLGWDSKDQLYDNVKLTGWHTGYGDAQVRIVPESCRAVPFEGDMLLFLAEFQGPAEQVCPRGLLRRVLDRAWSAGFSVTAACEFEFFLFDETPHTVREKGYKNLNNISPGFFGYSMLRSSVFAEFYQELLDTCNCMDFPVEGLHTETGPGVLEAALDKSDALSAADRAFLFKTYTKVLAQRRNWLATFMAKWSPDWPGQSGHIHLSMTGADGIPVFHDPDQPRNISETMRHFIGGQQALMPELLSMVAPTVNSFTRLIPGFWAPTAASWGIENRIEPDAPVQGNAYDANFSEERKLPATLYEAASRLRGSSAAIELFGEAFVDHYAATREWEEREFRKHITDWEMDRYFEII